MKTTTLFAVCLLFSGALLSQVGIGTTDPQATLDIPASDPSNPMNTDGILLPRITAFPTTDPTAAQQGMIVYMDNATAFAGAGFYYWDNNIPSWVLVGDAQWARDTNSNGDDLIYAIEAKRVPNNNDVVVTNDGFMGVGTDTPQSELHVIGSRENSRNNFIELTVENTIDEAELRLKPGGSGSPFWTFVANDDTTDGFMLFENNNANESVQVKPGGELRIEDLSMANTDNAGISYPATVYVESDGTLGVKTPYSRLDDLKVNTVDFATRDYAEALSALSTDETPALYTYTVTPTQDILLEVSFHLSVDFTQFGSATEPIDKEHNTKLFGTIIKKNGTPFSYKTLSFIGNNGINGGFINSDHAYIPLVADGTTYNITIHGYVQNDANDSEVGDSGIRGTFGGSLRDRLQIVEHK